MAMDRDQIKEAALQQIAQAEGFESDELSQMRKDALNYYYGRDSAAPSAAGRSSQQSTDVADMVEAVLAQVLPAFEIDNVIEFEPLGPDDEDQAHTESDAINYVAMEMNNGYYELQQAIRDALLLRNGLIKVYVDEKIDSNTEVYEGLTDMELSQLESSQTNNLQVEILDVETIDTLHYVKVKVTRTERTLKVEAVDITQFGWYLNHDSIYLDECPFVFERSFPTRSDLRVMGYTGAQVEGLNSTTADLSEDTTARNQGEVSDTIEAGDASLERIEYHECYMRLDADGDGIAELLKVCIADRTLMAVEPIEFIPYASGTPFIQAHRFNGLGLFDKIRTVQDSKTAVLRQWLDNQNHANNSRVTVIDGQVNISDVTNSRPGGIVRARSNGAVEPWPFADVGPSCENTLHYLDKMRSERGGASLDMQAAELQIAGDTAHGVERQMSAKEQLAAMITRTLAETLVRSTFQLVHKAMRLYFPDPIQIRARGKFAEVDPSQWPERDRLNVRAGLSTAERMRKKLTLEAIIARQDAMIQSGQGGIMVTPENQHNATIDWGRASGLDSPERYWQDPKSEEAQAVAQGQAEQAQAQEQYQQQLLEMQMQIEEGKKEIEEAKLHQAQHEADQDLKFKYWEAQLKAEIEEAKLVGSAVTTLGSKAIGSQTSGGSETVGDSGAQAA